MKQCTRCKQVLSPDNFHAQKGGGLKSWCRACTVSYTREKRLEARAERVIREQAAASGVRRKRKPKIMLSFPAYLQRFQEQGGVCASCGQPETLRTSQGDPLPLSADHDPSTGAVRALLCSGCFEAVRCFDDDPARLDAVIAYLRRHASAV